VVGSKVVVVGCRVVLVVGGAVVVVVGHGPYIDIISPLLSILTTYSIGAQVNPGPPIFKAT